MARTLIIKNADFSVNKLDTVEFASVPCTGISLDKSSSAITTVGGTDTLVATATPADTTDSIIWSTSNDNVVAVSGGVLTAIGCGTATITVTCGEFSDTCSVTVTHVASLTYALNRYLGKSSTKDYLDGGDLSNYAIGFSSSGSSLRISYDDRSQSRYPFVIPNGANNIVITCTNFKPYGFWLNSGERASISSAVALAYSSDSFGSKPSSAGNRTAVIPDRTTGTYEGMDSVAFVFQYMNGTISDSAMEEITVTFTA